MPARNLHNIPTESPRCLRGISTTCLERLRFSSTHAACRRRERSEGRIRLRHLVPPVSLASLPGREAFPLVFAATGTHTDIQSDWRCPPQVKHSHETLVWFRMGESEAHLGEENP